MSSLKEIKNRTGGQEIKGNTVIIADDSSGRLKYYEVTFPGGIPNYMNSVKEVTPVEKTGLGPEGAYRAYVRAQELYDLPYVKILELASDPKMIDEMYPDVAGAKEFVAYKTNKILQGVQKEQNAHKFVDDIKNKTGDVAEAIYYAMAHSTDVANPRVIQPTSIAASLLNRGVDKTMTELDHLNNLVSSRKVGPKVRVDY